MSRHQLATRNAPCVPRDDPGNKAPAGPGEPRPCAPCPGQSLSEGRLPCSTLACLSRKSSPSSVLCRSTIPVHRYGAAAGTAGRSGRQKKRSDRRNSDGPGTATCRRPGPVDRSRAA